MESGSRSDQASARRAARRRLYLCAGAILPLCFAWAWQAYALIPDGTPLFKWLAPVGWPATETVKEYRIYCDGVTAPIKVIAAPALQWQSSLGDVAAGPAHSCSVSAFSVSGVETAKSSFNAPFALPLPAPTGATVQ